MNRPQIIWGIAGLVVAAIVGVVLFYQLPSPDAPPEQAPAPVAGKESTAPGTVAAPAQDDGPVTPMAPQFDIVRVDPKGNIVIAGRASPNCKIIVRDGDTVVGTAVADRRGDWVVVPDEPLTPGERQLTLMAECDGFDPVPSDRIVVLAVPQRPEDGSLAVSVPRQGGGPSVVLQRPGDAAGQQLAARPSPQGNAGQAPVASTPVTLGAVDYDDAGNLALSGTAPPDSTVQIYLNNELIGRATADANGRWELTPDRKLAPGNYDLRIDQIAPDGKVVARVELPFVRGEPLTDLPAGSIVIIQPGDYLWKIARERYGSGVQYTLIFEANKQQIRNPDLIFPGQIFALPKVN